MKFFLTPPNQSLNSSQAWACLWTNLLVLPGLGSIMARRRVGYIQAVIAVAGVMLTGICLMELLGEIVSRQEVPANWHGYLWWGGGGLGAFIAGWCWSAWDSLQIVRRAKRDSPPPKQRMSD